MNWYKTAQRLQQNISKEDMESIKLIMHKIMTGHKQWTLKELQLQQNYPHLIEELLKQQIEKV